MLSPPVVPCTAPAPTGLLPAYKRLECGEAGNFNIKVLDSDFAAKSIIRFTAHKQVRTSSPCSRLARPAGDPQLSWVVEHDLLTHTRSPAPFSTSTSARTMRAYVSVHVAPLQRPPRLLAVPPVRHARVRVVSRQAAGGPGDIRRERVFALRERRDSEAGGGAGHLRLGGEEGNGGCGEGAGGVVEGGFGGVFGPGTRGCRSGSARRGRRGPCRVLIWRVATASVA